MNKKGTLISVVVILLIIIAGWFLVNNMNVNSDRVNFNEAGLEFNVEEDDNDMVDSADVMDLVVFLQDKDEVLTNDCGITFQNIIQVPKTAQVAKASLDYLFTDELSRYGEFKSVSIVDEVARVVIVNDNDPDGLRISGLSSCEGRHLMSVLSDTLTQYPTISAVELYSENGKIEF